MKDYFSNSSNSNLQNQQALSDSYQDARHINRVLAESQIQAEKEIQVYAAKQEISTQQSIYREEQKLFRRMSEDERKHNIYDELTITPDGAITATVCNLYDNAPSRVITNIRSPRLTRLIRLKNQEESAYQLTASIAGSTAAVYLESHKIGNGNYLVKRLAAQGIIFLAKAASQKKDYAQLLISVLLAQNPQSVYVPENPGWTDFPDNGLAFISEEEITWNNLKILLK